MATLPSWVEPQPATLTRQRFSDPGWIFERKLDGERCLAFAGSSGTRLMSPRPADITSTFPEIARALDDRRHGELVVDGEIVAFGQVGFSEWTEGRRRGARDSLMTGGGFKSAPSWQ